MQSLQRILALICFTLLVGQYTVLMLDIRLTESVALIPSAASSAMLIAVALTTSRSMKNWLLWFAMLYLLLYQFGSVIGNLTVDLGRSYIAYDTMFGTVNSEENRSISFILSGIVAAVFGLIAALKPPLPLPLPVNDPLLEKTARIIWILSAVPVILHLLWYVKTFSGSYVLTYSSSAKEVESIVPFISVFANIYTVAFYSWLAAVPKERSFNRLVWIFILVNILAAGAGARGLLILPLIFILWYRSFAYDRNIKRQTIILLSISLLAFIYLVENIRAEHQIDFAGLGMFFATSLSRAQQILGLYLENKATIDENGSHYWAAPLLFTFDYLFQGSQIVGQGELSADHRRELNHVMSSTLNYDAYLMGAGLGSSLVAEFYEYGAGLLLIFPVCFYLFYRYVFSLTNRRSVLVLIPVLFMHFVFSARDSLFPSSWSLLKLYIGFLIILFVLRVLYNFRFINKVDFRK